MTATSGRTCYELYGRYSPLGSLAKTLLASSRWYSPAMRLRWDARMTYSRRITFTERSGGSPSTKSARVLSERDIPSSRLLFRLVPSEHPTEEIGYGLLPTPTAQDFKRRGPNSKQQGLPEVVRKMIWLTPRASDGMRANFTMESLRRHKKKNAEKSNLAEQIAHKIGGGTSQLNPLFVEEMMGFPLDWLVSPFQDGGRRP